MTLLDDDDRATLEAGLASLERQERDLLLSYAESLKSGIAVRYRLTGYSDQLRELQRTIRRYKLAMKRAEIEASA